MYHYARQALIDEQEKIHINYQLRDRSLEAHTHGFAELIFMASGSCCQIIDGIRYEAEAGDLFFVNYGQTHAFCQGSEDMAYYNLLYVPQFFSEELINSENMYEIFRISLFREFEADRSEQTQKVSFRGEGFLQVRKLVEDMHREFQEKQVGYQSMLNGYSRVLFSLVLRQLQEKRFPEASKGIQRIISDCLAYIDAHCFERITPREIAEHAFYHPAYLSRVFKESCGCSLSEYIRNARLREAARLLSESELPLSQILIQIGYTDKTLFYKHFRDAYNMTPAQYRASKKS